MRETRDGSVLVVGAGPTGLTTAVELARRGVEPRIVDAEPAPVEESRALAVQPRTQEVWLDEGIAEAALERGIRVEAFNVHLEGKGPLHVSTTGMGGPFDQPLILPQDVTETLLVERLAELGVQVDRPTELVDLDTGTDGSRPRAELSTQRGSETVQPAWVVGADGAHSTVRHVLGVPFEGVPYPDRFVIADADVEAELATDELHAWIHEGRLLLVVPLRRPGHVRVITTHQPDQVEGDPDAPPALEAIQQLVDERATVPIELRKPRWVSVFRVHCRGVPRYRVGRVLLAGDAAHIHSPAGGLGMNTGIQDAHNLGWKLARVHDGRAPASLLDTYHDERHPVGQRVLETTDRFFQLAASDRWLAHLARRYVAAPLIGSAAVQRRLRAILSQRDITYPDSPIVGPDAGPPSGPRPGDQAPDGPVTGPEGTSVRLLELLAGGTGHAVLAFAGRPAPASLGPVRDLLAAARGHASGSVTDAWAIVPDVEKPNAPVIGDPDGQMHRRYGRREAGYEILRPDGHLGARSAGLDLELLDAYLERLTLPIDEADGRTAPPS